MQAQPNSLTHPTYITNDMLRDAQLDAMTQGKHMGFVVGFGIGMLFVSTIWALTQVL